MVGFLKRLFGGSDASVDPANQEPDEIYKDVEIRSTPTKESGGQWRLSGTISKQIDGVVTTRTFIRADLLQSRDEAVSVGIAKARMIVDQNGEGIWKGDENQPV